MDWECSYHVALCRPILLLRRMDANGGKYQRSFGNGDIRFPRVRLIADNAYCPWRRSLR
jgi:hypothetical protein